MPRWLTSSLTVVVILAVAVPALAEVPAAADLNQDGVVNQQDAAIFFQAWKDFRAGTAVASLPNYEPNADINSDGVIDHTDFELFTDSWLTSYTPSINPADYLVFNDGDTRDWVDSAGFFHWKDLVSANGVEGHSNWMMEQHIPTVHVGEVYDLWDVSGGTITDEGLSVGVSGPVFYATPMVLPTVLALNTPVVFNSDVDDPLGAKIGTMQMTLTLLAMNQTVAMGSTHTWSGVCAKVRIAKSGTINGQPWTDDRIEWWAPSTGPVQEDTLPSSPGTQIMTLQYLKVGATTYGSLPSAAVAGLFPSAQGNMYIFQGSDQSTDGLKMLAPKTLLAQSCATMGELGLPDGDSAQYWTKYSGSITGWAGFKKSGDPNDYAIESPPYFGTTFTMGDMVVGITSSVAYNGNTMYGYADFSLCPVAFEQTVNACGQTFQHCVVVDMYQVATKTTTGDLFENETRLWLAPGVGPVQVEEINSTPTPTSVRATGAGGRPAPAGVHPADVGSGPVPAIYIKVGSTTYGTQPTVDWGNAMQLAAGNAWGMSRGGSSTAWRVFAAEAPQTLGGLSCTPLTQVQDIEDQYDTFGDLKSDYYNLTADQVQIVGHADDPDGTGSVDPVTASSPMSLPRSLALGDSTTSAPETVDIGGQNVTIKVTVQYAGIGTGYAANGTTFPGCKVVDTYWQYTGGNNMEPEVYEFVYDSTVGLVEWHHWTPSDGWNDWYLTWARAGSNTWGGVSSASFDITNLWPLAQGNDWTLGPAGSPGSDYCTYSVGAQTTGGSYTYWPLTENHNGGTQPSIWFYDDTLSTARRMVGGSQYIDNNGPYTFYLTSPNPVPTEPRPWQIGAVQRCATQTTIGGQAMQARFIEVPVAFGLSVTTPAGTFNNCVGVAELQEQAAVSNPQWNWEHYYRVLAPGVGPVEYWRREGSAGGTVDTTYSQFGLLESADVGGTPYGP